MRLPFRDVPVAAHGRVAVRDVLLVRVTAADGTTGWGECSALPAPSYTSEYVDGAVAVLRSHLVPALLAGGDVEPRRVSAVLAGVRGHAMAKAALETAVLDCRLRSEGRRLAEALGGRGDRVEAGLSVGIAETVDALVEDVVAHVLACGYRRVKLKIRPGWDATPVRAVREALDPAVALQVDANGAYDPSDLGPVVALDGLGLALIEQPLPPDALGASVRLAAELATPVALDEAVTSVRAGLDLLELGAGDALCVKAAHLGGPLAAGQLLHACAERGADAYVGGMYDTALGRAVNAALASVPGASLPGDLPAPGRWLEQDVADWGAVDDGALRLPDGAGVGVEPDPEVLDRWGEWL